MEISARNQLSGTITSIKLGAVMAEVVVDVGGTEIVAAITNYVFYANPNLPALEFVDEEVKSNPGIYPPAETIAKAFVMKAHSPEFEEVLTRTWTRIKTGQ